MSSSATSQLQIYSNVKNYHSLVGFTILFYDYFLTLSMEVERFWSLGRFTWGAFLFYLNRYTAIFAHVPVLVEYFWPWTTETPLEKFKLFVICHAFHQYHQYYVIVAQIIIAIILVLRTYALYGSKRHILVVLVTAMAALLGLSCWAELSSGHSDPNEAETWPTIGCIESLTNKGGIHLAIAWSGLLSFDLLIYLLTLGKALGARGVSGRSLFHIVLRDASVYIAVIFAANISNVATLVAAPSALKGVSTTFSNIMASVIISRLLLNLRDPSLMLQPATSTAGARSGIRFQSAYHHDESELGTTIHSISEP